MGADAGALAVGVGTAGVAAAVGSGVAVSSVFGVAVGGGAKVAVD